MEKKAAYELINFYHFYAAYKNREMAKAADYASKLGDNYALGLIAKAVTALAMRAIDQAQTATRRLRAMDRAWCEYPKIELGKTVFEPTTLTRLMADLRAACL